MGEMIPLRARQAPAEHPTLDEVGEAMRTLRRLQDRFGSYDELVDLHFKATRLRLAQVFGDDDWLVDRIDEI